MGNEATRQNGRFINPPRLQHFNSSLARTLTAGDASWRGPAWAKIRLSLLLLWSGIGTAEAQFFFADATRYDYYDSGLGFVTSPSQLDVADGTTDKLPLTTTALFDRDALRLSWTSATGGDWQAFIIAPGFRTQDLRTSDTLGFWVWSPEVLAQAHLPVLQLEGATGGQLSARYPLNTLVGADLPAQQWVQVRVPLQTWRDDAANAGFNFGQVKAVILRQGAADGEPHRLHVDQVQVYSSRTEGIGQVTGQVTALAFPLHREIMLSGRQGSAIYYAIEQNGQLVKVLTARSGDTLLQAWLGEGQRDGGLLRVTTYTPGFGLSDGGATVQVGDLPALSDDEALWDMTQRTTLRYFWEFAHPVSGLARERNTSDNTVTTGGSGFGLMAWLVGIERGWLRREEVAQRLLTTLQFLEDAPRYHGVWPHWMDGRTGRTIPFSPRDDGGDIVETAFMAQALLTLRQYFVGATPTEDSIRTRATRLWEDIEWDWHVRPGEDVITWHWSPTQAWAINLKVRGFNEAQIVYILGIASPTHPIPARLYDSGWTGSGYRSFQGRYGIFLPAGPRSGGPMFFAHYSYLGFDPRYWRDDFANYFERNGRHVDYQVAYAADNPENHVGYSSSSWGFTASDDPERGYAVHAADEAEDNGTLTPTAALASMPYRPAAATAALRTFYERYATRVFGPLGFYDAFNPTLQWFATSTLAIDQGPIVGMIENHRSRLLWRLFMANPEIAPALLAAGFTPDSTTVAVQEQQVLAKAALRVYPNPSTGHVSILLPAANAELGAAYQIELRDVLGRVALRQNLLWTRPHDAVELDLGTLTAGQYLLTLKAMSPRGPLSAPQHQTFLQILAE